MSCLVDHTVNIAADVQTVWNKMIDWRTWPSWDCGMESVSFPGPLASGSKGRLKLKGGPEVELTVTDLREGDSYTSQFVLLGTTFVFGHTLRAEAARTSMRFTVDAAGWTASLLSLLVGPKISRGVPEWMGNFQAALKRS